MAETTRGRAGDGKEEESKQQEQHGHVDGRRGRGGVHLRRRDGRENAQAIFEQQ